MSSLSVRDYDHVLDVVTSVLGSFETATPWRVVGRELLHSLFRAEVFLFADVDYDILDGRWVETMSAVSSTGVEPGASLPDELLSDHPFSWHYGHGAGSTAVLRVSDLASPLVFRGTAGYRMISELFGTGHALAVPLRDKPFRALGVLRGAADFGDRDVALGQRIQPLLTAFDGHARQLERWRAGLASEPAGSGRVGSGGAGSGGAGLGGAGLGGAGLGRASSGRAADHAGQPREAEQVAATLEITPREITVLVALADGLTAAGIARRLNISVRTVGNHLTSLYRKLDAPDRLTAVLRAHHLGLLPPRGLPRPSPSQVPRPRAPEADPRRTPLSPDRPAAAGTALTARERQVAGLAAAGLANRRIAGELALSVRTVENHLRLVYRKLGVGRERLGEALHGDHQTT
ncbi:LuxR C-terminal-related transcriptional regulator [Pseudofrankia inefficax]|uniref:Transcriptional regulator, LuxR family n=1 Tax=Pseudofrankia inefficax (strain DSM 45817 / CECT 9037 / DDB 130130 / EuI1c) TaxID=298654 RepID=E3JCT4_PSEI1|nr:LuxR C-terminal-related transcriptional regulator [Pseudofrankia inefficax]ADP79924.1 transcriptional regulator, LuxR family [Pseudofrankia inefficax]